ncbi:hypothetical protein D5086_027838 [Populus alba]|uniref:Uncharacterized protein n=1 Tax=Populus alba TaxID=43335 RepID=A0ACC4AX40_POPAL
MAAPFLSPHSWLLCIWDEEKLCPPQQYWVVKLDGNNGNLEKKRVDEGGEKGLEEASEHRTTRAMSLYL